jgi:hypothetical protein
MRQDSPVLFVTQAQGQRGKLTDEDSSLLEALGELKVDHNHQSMTKNILSLLQGHSRFHFVKRFCVAERLGISNQLRTVCSATDSLIANTMESGYTCFLNSTGSIFKITDQKIRVFRNVDDVVASFSHNGTPIQRSMSRIASMGMENSLCWGLFRGQILGALIFINGQGRAWHEPSHSDYQIFSRLSQVIENRLLQTRLPSPAYFHLVKGKEKDCIGSTFDQHLLCELVTATILELSQTTLQVSVAGDLPVTLVNHGHIAQMIGRLVSALNPLPHQLLLSTSLRSKQLRFVLSWDTGVTLNENDYRVALAQSDGEKLGIAITYIPDSIVLEIPYDGPAIYCYSTAVTY